MGAVTNSNKKTFYHSGGKIIVSDVTWSNSYASGGDTYTNAQFGVAAQVDAFTGLVGLGATNTGLVVGPDIANKKLKLFGGAASGVALAQASGDQSGTVARMVLFCDDPYV